MRHAVLPFFLVICVALFNACESKVNRVNLQLENDFHGLMEVLATPSATKVFTGDVRIPRDGHIEVKEASFTGEMRISARRLDGTNLDVELIRNEAPNDAFGVWQFGSGAFVHYFYVGSRIEAEDFYRENQERLYRIPESRLRRSENGEFELIVPEN